MSSRWLFLHGLKPYPIYNWRGMYKVWFQFCIWRSIFLNLIRTILLSLLSLNISYKSFSKARGKLLSNTSCPSCTLFNSEVWISTSGWDYNMPCPTHISCVQSTGKVTWSHPKMLQRCFPTPNWSETQPETESLHGNNSHRGFKRFSNSCFAGSKTVSWLFPKNSKQHTSWNRATPWHRGILLGPLMFPLLCIFQKAF